MIMEPLVERYLKFFKDEVKQNTALLRAKHAEVKDKFSKLMPMEHGIMKMVVDHLPAPYKAQKHRFKIFCPFLAQPALKD